MSDHPSGLGVGMIVTIEPDDEEVDGVGMPMLGRPGDEPYRTAMALIEAYGRGADSVADAEAQSRLGRKDILGRAWARSVAQAVRDLLRLPAANDFRH